MGNFNKSGGGGRFDNRGGGRGFGGRGGRPDMHRAICSECGNECEVPFKPTGDKPVYCNTCFGKGEGFKPKKTDEYKQEFDRLNTKLDRIIKALEAAGLKKEPAIVKPVAEAKKEEVKEPSFAKATADKKPAAKKAKKKGVKKKPVAKKVTKKKAVKSKKK